jgi:protease I
MPKRIPTLVGDFVEDYEAMLPFQALAGGIHEEVALDAALVDGNAWPAHPAWLAALLGVLEGTALVEETAP